MGSGSSVNDYDVKVVKLQSGKARFAAPASPRRRHQPADTSRDSPPVSSHHRSAKGSSERVGSIHRTGHWAPRDGDGVGVIHFHMAARVGRGKTGGTEDLTVLQPGSEDSQVSRPLDEGPFFHGTIADLKVGEFLTAGRRSNYRPEIVMNHIYFTARRRRRRPRCGDRRRTRRRRSDSEGV